MKNFTDDKVLESQDDSEASVITDLQKQLSKSRNNHKADKFLYNTIIIFLLCLPVFIFAKSWTGPVMALLFACLIIVGLAKKYNQVWAEDITEQIITLVKQLK